MPLVKVTGFAPGHNIASAELNGVVISISTWQAFGVLHAGGGKRLVALQGFVEVSSVHCVPVCVFVVVDVGKV